MAGKKLPGRKETAGRLFSYADSGSTPISNAKRKRFPKIHAAYLRVARQSFGTAGAEDASFVNDVGTIGDGESFADVVVRDQNAYAGTLQIENDALQFEYLNRVDSAEGLVEQQKARIDD